LADEIVFDRPCLIYFLEVSLGYFEEIISGHAYLSFGNVVNISAIFAMMVSRLGKASGCSSPTRKCHFRYGAIILVVQIELARE
jgi:hypothetical protein